MLKCPSKPITHQNVPELLKSIEAEGIRIKRAKIAQKWIDNLCNIIFILLFLFFFCMYLSYHNIKTSAYSTSIFSTLGIKIYFSFPYLWSDYAVIATSVLIVYAVPFVVALIIRIITQCIKVKFPVTAGEDDYDTAKKMLYLCVDFKKDISMLKLNQAKIQYHNVLKIAVFAQYFIYIFITLPLQHRVDTGFLVESFVALLIYLVFCYVLLWLPFYLINALHQKTCGLLCRLRGNYDEIIEELEKYRDACRIESYQKNRHIARII